ncbi:MAG TPA: hypothetical protein VK615_01905 [Candidatus Binatia bacterium]|nr:hypothetical protein [Candidatus Binatia bacterium]
MNPDPLSLALQEITETRRLLETLITSSESFDYPKAKMALEQLTRKVRDLRKREAQLQAQIPVDPKIRVLDFSKAETRAQV